jgi:predicted RNA-binding Zn-ribbon protein involved in translation (DUF1610 family)
MEQRTLTYEEQECERRERLAELGTEPPCPLCGKSRVSRSDYIRCLTCGLNWLNEEMHLRDYLNRDPRAARSEAARTTIAIRPTAGSSAEGAER